MKHRSVKTDIRQNKTCTNFTPELKFLLSFGIALIYLLVIFASVVIRSSYDPFAK